MIKSTKVRIELLIVLNMIDLNCDLSNWNEYLNMVWVRQPFLVSKEILTSL